MSRDESERLAALVQRESLSVEEQATAIALYGSLVRQRISLPSSARAMRQWALTERRCAELCAQARSWLASSRHEGDAERVHDFVQAMTLLLLRSNAALLQSAAWRSLLEALPSSIEARANDQSQASDEAEDRAIASAIESWVQRCIERGEDVAELEPWLESAPTMRALFDDRVRQRWRARAPVALAALALRARVQGSATVPLPVRPPARWAADTASEDRRSFALGRLSPTPVDARLIADREKLELRLVAERNIVTRVRLGAIELCAPTSEGPGARRETWKIELPWPDDPVSLEVEARASTFTTVLSFVAERA